MQCLFLLSKTDQVNHTELNVLFQPTALQFCKHRFLTMNNNFAMNRLLFTVLFTTQRSRKFSKWSYCPRWRKEVWRNKGLSYYIALKCSSPVLNPAFCIHIGSKRITFSGVFHQLKMMFLKKIPLIHSILYLLWIFLPFHLLPHPVLPFSATSPVPSRNVSFDGPLHFFTLLPSHLPDCKTTFYYYNLTSGLLWHSLLNHRFNFTVFNSWSTFEPKT